MRRSRGAGIGWPAWLVAMSAAAPCVSSPPPPPAEILSKVQVYESRSEAFITEGDTTLEVDPDRAYATLADVARWPHIFPNVLRVEVTHRDGDDARITVIGPRDHHDNLHFHNRPAERTVWFEDTGGSAEVWVETAFLPGDRAGTTHVHTRLFGDVHGAAAVFVSDGVVRAMRRDRVARDLADLHDYFASDAQRSADRPR